jgi:hypothetical protein
VKYGLQIGVPATGVAVFPAPADRDPEDGIMGEAMTETRGEPETASGPDPLARMAEEIRLLDEAAERAATRVSEAAGELRDGGAFDFHAPLLADLSASLVERVNEIQAECGRLSGMLARATKVSARSGAPTPGPTPIPDRPAPEVFKAAIRNGSASAKPRPERAPARPRLDRRRSPGQSTPEGVRLAATQMAVAGSSRSEIERVLRLQFGVRDADAALDEIFGTRPSEVR